MKRISAMLVMLLVSAAYVLGFHEVENVQAGGKNASEQEDGAKSSNDEVSKPKTVDVYLRRQYIDGKTTVEMEPVTVLSMEDFWAEFSKWKKVDQHSNQVVFKKRVNDISPLLKASGYFGLSEDDMLMIYDGKPNEKRAVHSFFQIDVKELESDIHKDLKDGIPVETKGHYEEVIQSLEKYAVKQ